jgi:hypothetical protein
VVVNHNELIVLIPIVAIVMGIGIAMLAMWLDYRKKRDIFQLHHSERMAAIEKGIDLPSLPSEFFTDYRRRPRVPADYLRRGLVWLLVGIALVVALFESGSEDFSWSWGLVPTAVGAAYLLFYGFTRRSETQRQPGVPGSSR